MTWKPWTLLAAIAAVGAVSGGLAVSAQPSSPGASGTTITWPRRIAAGEISVTLHQPQIDGWSGERIDGRLYAEVREASSAPVYGGITFTARTSVDKTARVVAFGPLSVVSVSFPRGGDKAGAWAELIEAQT